MQCSKQYFYSRLFFDVNKAFDSCTGLVSGWGDTVSPSHGSPSCQLRATKQTVLSSDDRSCTELTGYQVDKSKLCAFYPNTSGCPVSISFICSSEATL